MKKLILTPTLEQDRLEKIYIKLQQKKEARKKEKGA